MKSGIVEVGRSCVRLLSPPSLRVLLRAVRPCKAQREAPRALEYRDWRMRREGQERRWDRTSKISCSAV